MLEKVKIGGIEYNIEYIEIPEEDGAYAFAEIDHALARIQVNSVCNEQIQEVSILHEIVHAVLFNIGEQKLNGNEKFVECFTQAWYQVLRDNKGLIM